MTKFCFPRCPSILLVVRRVVNSNHHFLALSPAPLNDPTFPVAVRQTPLLFMISTLLPDDYFSKLDIILEKKVFLTFCPHLYTFYSSQRRGHRHWDLRVAPDSLLLGHCYRHFAIFALRVFQGNEDTVVVKKKDFAILPLHLGGPRVRKSCHIPPGSPLRWRFQGTR